jgi:putative transposase
MPNQVTRPRQQEMQFRTHGGARAGAGRKPAHPGRPRLRHGKRPALEARFPVHVTKRVRRDVTRLRRFELCKVLRGAFVHGCLRGAFRICQFSIQGNHIHLICEASDGTQLARGIQGWSVRVARGLNGYLGRTGSVFDDRYHLEILTTPTQTRHALCYVLQNARRHGEPIDPRFGGMDPFSSAWWFDGWKDASWKVGIPPPEMRTVAEAKTWLMRVGWKRSASGLLSITETPPAGRR